MVMKDKKTHLPSQGSALNKLLIKNMYVQIYLHRNEHVILTH